MGLMDTVKGLLGGNTQLTGFVDGLQNFVTQNGGMEGLKNKFEKEGAGSIVQSWISTGPNLPITNEQIQKVMGNQFVQDMAKKMGVDPATATQKITQMLPTIIDKLSPNGKLPENLDTKSIMTAATDLITKH